MLFLPMYCLDAKCRKQGTIKYKQDDYNWSKKYTVDITFMTGTEMNQATGSLTYESYYNYAVIFWDNDQTTIIKINFLTCAYTNFDCSCLNYVSTDLRGNDKRGIEWNICLSGNCY